MLNAERNYFRVTSGPCFTIIADWKAKRRAIEEACLEFAQSVGGTGFYAGNDDNVGNGVAIHAVTFEGDLPAGWKERRLRHFADTDDKIPAWPDQRTKIGKAALAAIKALPRRPSSYHVCDAIGFPSTLKYSGNGTIEGYDSMGVFDTALIGWLADAFYIALPKLTETRQGLIDRGYTVETPDWAPLPGMEPILKEEMQLDFARAKLAKAETADA